MYQFLVSTQGFTNNVLTELTDKEGNKTGYFSLNLLKRISFQFFIENHSHLVGLFNRSIQFLENGIKPVWIFDGKPPTLKGGEVF